MGNLWGISRAGRNRALGAEPPTSHERGIFADRDQALHVTERPPIQARAPSAVNALFRAEGGS